jgi:hypothetical protein
VKTLLLLGVAALLCGCEKHVCNGVCLHPGDEVVVKSDGRRGVVIHAFHRLASVRFPNTNEFAQSPYVLVEMRGFELEKR